MAHPYLPPRWFGRPGRPSPDLPMSLTFCDSPEAPVVWVSGPHQAAQYLGVSPATFHVCLRSHTVGSSPDGGSWFEYCPETGPCAGQRIRVTLPPPGSAPDFTDVVPMSILPEPVLEIPVPSPVGWLCYLPEDGLPQWRPRDFFSSHDLARAWGLSDVTVYQALERAQPDQWGRADGRPHSVLKDCRGHHWMVGPHGKEAKV